MWSYILTLKAMSYVSSMRSNLALLRRSKQVPGSIIHAAQAEISSYLAQKVLIYPKSLLMAGLKPDMTFQERKAVLNLATGGSTMTDEEADFARFLESSGRKGRKANWIWRVGSECEDMRDKGWYPFFVTLTVDPARCSDSQQMWKDGVELRRYFQRLARVSAEACGQAGAIRDGVSWSQFVRHVGVIEHGKSRHHHHMHLLIWMRGIPEKWKVCPNRGIADPRSRTINFCRQMSTYWPLALPGLGRALYFRHEGDIWSRLGFAIPVNKNDRKPMQVMPARLAGVYVAKYMDKGDKAWLHRVKATRDLGKGRLRNLLHQLNLSTVRALMWRPRQYSTSVLVTTIHCVPQGLLRSMAKQVLFCREWDDGTLDSATLLRPSSDVFFAMRKSVRDGARPRRMSSEAFYEWVTGHLPAPDGYCERRVRSAHLQLKVEFPVCHAQPVSHLGGMTAS